MSGSSSGQLQGMHNQVKIDLVCNGKISRLTFPIHVLMEPGTDRLVLDPEAVSLIYGRIVQQITRSEWFDVDTVIQIMEHFESIMNLPLEDITKRSHIRGLTYILHGRDVILISNYAKSIKRKLRDQNFVLQYDLERAFSTNEKLLATVTNGKSAPFLAEIRSDINVLTARDEGADTIPTSITNELHPFTTDAIRSDINVLTTRYEGAVIIHTSITNELHIETREDGAIPIISIISETVQLDQQIHPDIGDLAKREDGVIPDDADATNVTMVGEDTCVIPIISAISDDNKEDPDDTDTTNVTTGEDTSKLTFDIYPDDDYGYDGLSMDVPAVAITDSTVNANKFPDDDYGYEEDGLSMDVPAVATTDSTVNANKFSDDDYGYDDGLVLTYVPVSTTGLNVNAKVPDDHGYGYEDDAQLDRQMDQLRCFDAILSDAIRSFHIGDLETREDGATQLRRIDPIRSDEIRSDIADLETREDGAALLQLDQMRSRAVEIVRSETREDTEMTIDISYQDDDSGYDSSYHTDVTDLPLGEDTEMTIDISYQDDDYGYDPSSQDSYRADVMDLPLGEDTEMTIDISYQDDDYGYDPSCQDSYRADVTDLPLGEDTEMTIDISYQDDDYGYDPSQDSYRANVSHLPTRMKLREQPAVRNDLNADMRRDIMRALWTYKVKLRTNKKKALICGDGTRPLRPWHKSMQEHYATCASMTALQSTIDIAAFENSILSATDVVDAYAQSGRKPSDGYSTTSIHSDQWNFAEVRIHMANCKLLQ
eukprot:scaffold577_cov273-Chaetoceros_neogracile.AAC.16